MAGETIITVVGNLTRDPELRTVGNGSTVVNFTIASSTRQFNRNTNQWENGDTLFLNCSAWDSQYSSLASNIANSLSRGMSVIAQGRLTQRSYQAQDGTQRQVVELRVDEIGPSLRRATAQVSRSGFVGNQQSSHTNGGYQGGAAAYQGGANYAAPQQQPAQAPAADPWNSAEPAESTFGSFGTTEFGGDSSEPEF